MFNRENIGRELLMLFIGAAITVIFGIMVAYPAMLANVRENAARIESQEKRIELLWEAHQISHITPTADGGERDE